jgi:hypothetical protein
MMKATILIHTDTHPYLHPHPHFPTSRCTPNDSFDSDDLTPALFDLSHDLAQLTPIVVSYCLYGAIDQAFQGKLHDTCSTQCTHVAVRNVSFTIVRTEVVKFSSESEASLEQSLRSGRFSEDTVWIVERCSNQ